MKQIFTVIKYEYLKAVKNKTFLIATFLIPVLMAGIMAISIFSSKATEQKLKNLPSTITQVDILDESGFINKDLIKPPLQETKTQEQGINNVQDGSANAFIFIPKDFNVNAAPNSDFNFSGITDAGNENNIKIYSVYEGLFSADIYANFATTLIKTSAGQKVDDAQITSILVGTIPTTKVYYTQSGEEYTLGIGDFLVPGFALFVFFILIIGNSQSLLQSVAMEKENRMIEIMLSIIPSKTLVRGKILGLMFSGMTQLLIWIVIATAGVIALNSSKFGNLNLNIDFSNISILSVFLSLYLAFCGFLTIASIMVGVGAMGKNYRDSQSLSSIFILIAIFPIYFITILVTDPNSTIAVIFSYVPLTAPMILLLRSAFGQMGAIEIIIGCVLVLIYTIIAFYIAPKLFDLGALMYSRRPTMKEVVKTILPIG